ncbi:nop15p nopp34 nucleolar with 1 RRM domain [Cryptosporidium sp. chipmunk genotype I]|uniref:nop15p nopp34 nucleolar with 1 RRM domain n=1 Tax=Cryptosporidium sp. chipmunk genotype I TaxID=1280935 RepID=UPI00351A830C|nr:nop15p nopp34 nucleolar with 1 RRM domain [Cryptosporidium sp. chipmunk genotype I]
MSKAKRERAIVYVGHIPFGLFEPQLKEYFSQFGKILRIKLSRSKKNGHSRGYAFIEFESMEVAQIAASTMNNYIIFKRSLKCHVLPKESIHPYIFIRSKKKSLSESNSNLSQEEKRAKTNKSVVSRKKKLLKISKVLEKEGINYKLPSV